MNDSLRLMDRRQRLRSVLCWAVMVFAPFLLLGVLSLVMGRNALNAYPVWSDELDYWRTLYSWDAVGFNTGYSGMYEVFAPVGTLSVHGIAPIMLYGWFVKLFGLSCNTIVLCNAVWISLAALAFCLLLRPRPAISLAFAALLTLYAPIILYCTTSMTELFNYALLLFYLTFLLRYHQKRSPWMLAFCCLTLAVACLYRISYFILFIPVVLVDCRFRFDRRMLISGLAALAVCAACYLLSTSITAPYIQGFLYQLLHADSMPTFLQMLISHTKSNLVDYFFRVVHPMEAAQRWLYCIVMLLCLVGSFLRLSRAKAKRLSIGLDRDLLGCFLLLGSAFAIICILYEANDWADYRTLAPFLWLVLGYLCYRRKWIVPSAALAGMLATLLLLATLPPVGAFSDAERFKEPERNENLSEVIALIAYEPSATNPLTNTVRIDVPGFQAVKELAPGLGLQYGWFTTETTGKSRWILTDHLKCVVNGYDRVSELEGYKVYRRIDSYEDD